MKYIYILLISLILVCSLVAGFMFIRSNERQHRRNNNFLTKCYICDAERLQRLIDYGANVNAKDKQGKTALMMLARSGKDVSQLECLINNGADVNILDNDGNSALFNAILNTTGKQKIFTEYLLSKGANVNKIYKAKNSQPKTALDIAILFFEGLKETDNQTIKNKVELENSYKKIIDLLRKHGAKTYSELKAEKNTTQPCNGPASL